MHVYTAYYKQWVTRAYRTKHIGRLDYNMNTCSELTEHADKTYTVYTNTVC